MYEKNRKDCIQIAVVVLLLFFAYVCRYVEIPFTNVLINTILINTRNLIHISLLVTWCISVHRRIIHKKIRDLLMGVGLLMVLWLVVRTCKYEFLYSAKDPLGRYCWYGYYIPMILIPLLGVYIVTYIGKEDTGTAPKWTKYLGVLAGGLLLAVMTNDLHQLVFSFPEGFEKYDNVYRYGFLYYIVMSWFILAGSYFVIMLLIKSRVPGSRFFKSFPAAIMGGAVIFWILYSMRLIKCDLTACDILIITLLLESTIQSGLIRSNSRYEELFARSTIPMQITDRADQSCFSSETAEKLPQDVMEASKSGLVSYKDTQVYHKEIKGGHVLWQADVKKINELVNKLQEIQEQQKKNNQLLQEELEIKRKKVRMEEKRQLYEKISKELSEHFPKVEQLLLQAEQKPEETEQILKKLCVLGAYMKRKENLLLLGEGSSRIPAEELNYCFRELLENLKITGAVTLLTAECQGELLLQDVIAVFDLHEKMIEAVFEQIVAVMIQLECSHGKLHMRTRIGCDRKINPEIFSGIVLENGTLQWETEEEDLFVEVSLTGGMKE